MTLRSELDRRALIGLLAAAGAAPLPARAQGRAFDAADYGRIPVIDMQAGLGPPEDPLAGVRESGLTAISTTVGLVGNGPGRWDSVVSDIAGVEAAVDAYPHALSIVRRASDLAAARQAGRLAILLNTQDTTALDGDAGRVKALKDLGVRVLQLTYNKRNLCADGCLEPGNAGLSDFGRQVIHEANANHLLLDLSHGGQRTVFEAAQACTAPPAVTHSGCRDLVDNPRNIYDREMKAVADKGGVVGIYFMNYLRVASGGAPVDGRAEDVIRHVEHALQVCGEDHIGLGTDGGIPAVQVTDDLRAAYKSKYDFRVKSGFFTPGDAPDIYNWIPDYNTPHRFLNLGQDLAKRGWPTARIEKLVGGNFNRLLGEVLDA